MVRYSLAAAAGASSEPAAAPAAGLAGVGGHVGRQKAVAATWAGSQAGTGPIRPGCPPSRAARPAPSSTEPPGWRGGAAEAGSAAAAEPRPYRAARHVEGGARPPRAVRHASPPPALPGRVLDRRARLDGRRRRARQPRLARSRRACGGTLRNRGLTVPARRLGRATAERGRRAAPVDPLRPRSRSRPSRPAFSPSKCQWRRPHCRRAAGSRRSHHSISELGSSNFWKISHN